MCLQKSRFGDYWLYIQYSAWYRYTCPVPWPPPLLSAVHCLTRGTRGTRVPTQATVVLTHILLHSFYNVIYSSDKPRFLKMCVSATVSELLSVICLIWYVPASEVLLQLWRILRCSSLRNIMCCPKYRFSIDTVCWRWFGDNRFWHLSYILRWEELQITIKSTRKVRLLGEKFRFSHKLLFRPFSLVLTFPAVSRSPAAAPQQRTTCTETVLTSGHWAFYVLDHPNS